MRSATGSITEARHSFAGSKNRARFDRREAEKFEVLEQTVRTGADEVLTLILITDPDMLEDAGDR